jgi:threonine dehydrogenase-like Zn-dependent dehydrogenase
LYITIVACAEPSAVTKCLDILAPGGTCVLFSTLPSEPIVVDMNRIRKRRQRITVSR